MCSSDLTPDTEYKFITQAPQGFANRPEQRPIVVGTGPCGLFAALLLAQMGFRPIVLERGKIVRERTKDTWGLWRKRELHAESNVQYGEGGAGTFSDGKLWSQVKDPMFHGRKVLREMIKGGAPDEIMYVSKPHIGTFRLVKVVEYLREQIIAMGGEFRFQCKVVDVLIEGTRKLDSGEGLDNAPDIHARRNIHGVRLESGEELLSNHVIMAIGHSARDTFEMLLQRGVYMEAKPFSVGFRIEHPQGLIDQARFGAFAGHKGLGAADYKLVHHAKNGRSVYSFCMCPGGTVVAATSEAGHVVTNGMSQYSRNERNANAGIVVSITPHDYRRGAAAGGEVNPLDGIAFQRHWEARAFELGGRTYAAPGQLVGDFLAGRPSSTLGSVEPSYKPGVLLTNLAEPGQASLPDDAIAAIREALPAFDRQIKGFAMHDAVLTGVETRTSSPLRITRGTRFESINVAGLYPAGEGAGYAGGIMSAAIDGIEVAEAVARSLLGVNEPATAPLKGRPPSPAPPMR